MASEGVVVDLASDETFRYPVLYLTGHLPMRFSDAETGICVTTWNGGIRIHG